MLSECYVIACVSLASWCHVTLAFFFLKFETIGGIMLHENRLSDVQHNAVHLKLASGTWIIFSYERQRTWACEKNIARKHIGIGWNSLNLMQISAMHLSSEETKCWK